MSECKYFKPTEGKYIALQCRVFEKLGRPPKPDEQYLVGNRHVYRRHCANDDAYATHEALRELAPPIPPDGYALKMEPGADGVMAPAFRVPKAGEGFIADAGFRLTACADNQTWKGLNDGYRWILTPLPKPEPVLVEDVTWGVWSDAYSGPERRKDAAMRAWWSNRRSEFVTGDHAYCVREAYRRGAAHSDCYYDSKIDELRRERDRAQDALHAAAKCIDQERARASKAEALLRRALAIFSKDFYPNLFDDIRAFLPPADKRQGERRKVKAEVRFVVNDDRCRGWAVLRGSDEHGEIWGNEHRTPHDRRKGGAK